MTDSVKARVRRPTPRRTSAKRSSATLAVPGYGVYDVFHNWLAGPRPYARRVVTGVIATTAEEAIRLYQAHVDRSDLVDDAVALTTF
jgi:hypothetical protein